MATTRIIGGNGLNGSIAVSGSKNACLPMLAAALLTEDECILHNVPKLSDVSAMVEILRAVGAQVGYVDEHSISVKAENVFPHVANADLVGKIRASVCLVGALLCRLGQASVPVPGGCIIGNRSIDLHIAGFKALGCSAMEIGGEIVVNGSAIHSANINLLGKRGSTMTGTINVAMAALRAEGKTTIECAAREPEVVDFCNYLTAMGAQIGGIGTATLEITGGTQLHGCEYAAIGDRIEAGTLICAGLITGGNLEVIGLEYGLLDSFLAVLREMGADVMQSSDGIFRVKPGKNLHAVDVVTAPHPGFPTDLQAQLCSLLTQVDGVSTLTEVIYPDRFLHIPELGKLGADVSLENASAVIGGPAKLVGTRLQSTDLRASAALYIAGLCASGETHIDDVHHLDRGYEDLDGKLRALGADIERIES